MLSRARPPFPSKSGDLLSENKDWRSIGNSSHEQDENYFSGATDQLRAKVPYEKWLVEELLVPDSVLHFFDANYSFKVSK